MVNEIIQKILSGDCDNPDVLSKDLLILSANQYSVGQDITKWEIAYSKKWNEERTKFKTDKACDMALKQTEEYQKWEQAKNAYRMMKEVIMAGKKRLAVLSDEGKSMY